MKFTLLTHQKELSRNDNTGSLISQLQDCVTDKVIWQRKDPNQQLVAEIQAGTAVLLTPDSSGRAITDISSINHLVILDSTWQEARKMINKSDYLKQADWFALNNPPPSRYNLRRNQIIGGLCTAECAIEILKLKQMNEAASQLEVLYAQLLGRVLKSA